MSASSRVPPVWPLMPSASVLLVTEASELELSIMMLPEPPVTLSVVKALSEIPSVVKLETVTEVMVPFRVDAPPPFTSVIATELVLTPA